MLGEMIGTEMAHLHEVGVCSRRGHGPPREVLRENASLISLPPTRATRV